MMTAEQIIKRVRIAVRDTNRGVLFKHTITEEQMFAALLLLKELTDGWDISEPKK